MISVSVTTSGRTLIVCIAKLVPVLAAAERLLGDVPPREAETAILISIEFAVREEQKARLASAIAPYVDQEASAVAEDLDVAVVTLLLDAAG